MHPRLPEPHSGGSQCQLHVRITRKLSKNNNDQAPCGAILMFNSWAGVLLPQVTLMGRRLANRHERLNIHQGLSIIITEAVLVKTSPEK